MATCLPSAPPVSPDAAPAPADPLAGEVLVLVAHPQMEQSRVNRAMRKAAQAAAAASGGRIVVLDLYERYPDYLIDTAAEQARLAAARLVVWQGPMHWYSLPPLLRLWMDEVLAFGWAYGPGGEALRGKDLWLAVSTGGSAEAYRPQGHNRHYFDAFLPPLEQTAALCGLRFLPPLVLHGAHQADAAEVAAHAALYASRLAAWPAWPEIEDLPDCIACEVPPGARPEAEEGRP